MSAETMASATPMTAAAPQGQAAPTGKSLADCFYFLQGNCVKGDSCRFRHSPAALANPNPCRFWMLGYCAKPDCPFRHPADRTALAPWIPPVQQPQGHTTASPASQGVECLFFKQGSCRNGFSCPYLHVLPSGSPATTAPGPAAVVGGATAAPMATTSAGVMLITRKRAQEQQRYEEQEDVEIDDVEQGEEQQIVRQGRHAGSSRQRQQQQLLQHRDSPLRRNRLEGAGFERRRETGRQTRERLREVVPAEAPESGPVDFGVKSLKQLVGINRAEEVAAARQGKTTADGSASKRRKTVETGQQATSAAETRSDLGVATPVVQEGALPPPPTSANVADMHPAVPSKQADTMVVSALDESADKGTASVGDDITFLDADLSGI